MEKYWNQQSNFFIYTSFHLVHQKWQFAVAILSGVSGVTHFLLYHSTDIVLIEKNHLVQLKKAFLSNHNKWSYALFTLLFNWHSSNCQNHLVQLKMAFLSGHNKWSYALFTLLFNWHSSNCQNHLLQLKMAFSNGHNKWMDYGVKFDRKVYSDHWKLVYESLILSNTVFVGKSLS